MSRNDLIPCESLWAETAMRSGLTAVQSAEEFHALARAYTEPHRHYHTLRHVEEMLVIAHRLVRHVTDFTSVQWAIWYHDAVYDPRAKDNEERSAEWAGRSLTEWGMNGAVIRSVESLILETKHAGRDPSSPDAAVLLDADLSVLGAEADRYDDYARAIRAEYAFVPDAEYRAGRTAVLQGFLNRPRLYFTDELFHERDAPARANLLREIEALARD